jgi:hypothetical protein
MESESKLGQWNRRISRTRYEVCGEVGHLFPAAPERRFSPLDILEQTSNAMPQSELARILAPHGPIHSRMEQGEARSIPRMEILVMCPSAETSMVKAGAKFHLPQRMHAFGSYLAVATSPPMARLSQFECLYRVHRTSEMN